jgi:thiol:disulfide interchange protein DsbD
VVEEAEAEFVMLKVDLTQKGNPLHEGLLAQYDVRGVPTVVFLDKQGRERPDLRVVNYLPPAQMLERMSEITNTGS